MRNDFAVKRSLALVAAVMLGLYGLGPVTTLVGARDDDHIGTRSQGRGEGFERPKAKTQAACPIVVGKTNKKGSQAACPMMSGRKDKKGTQATCPMTGGKKQPQSACPIMGGRINKKLYVDVDGKRIYVCCKMCIAKVKEDPKKALKALAARGEEAESLEAEQKICPIMGGKTNKKLFVEHDAKKIYVCCKMCIGKVKKDPAKYAKKVAEEIAKEKTKAAKKVWTCAMHPQLKVEKAGKCAICGMGLIPAKSATEK